MVLLLETYDVVHFSPITYTRFLWDVSLGAMTPKERATHEFGEVCVWSPRFNDEVWEPLKSSDDVWRGEEVSLVLNVQFVFPFGFEFRKGMGITPEGKWVYLCGEPMTDEIRVALEGQNVSWLGQRLELHEVREGLYYRDVADVVNRQESALHLYEAYFARHKDFVSPEPGVYLHRQAVMDSHVVFHAKTGAIVVDEKASLRAFSIIDGPAYVGRESLIESGRIREATTIRDKCKVGGEVEWSIIESYSNKHHEGFLGHSYVGSWVNIGAMATTSDLKNNYRPVVIQRREGVLETRTNKFGSIIADFVKIGIGIMLSTGTVIEPGVNAFIEAGRVQPEKYLSGFLWGGGAVYDWERFWRDATTMMRRRGFVPSEAYREFLQRLHASLTKRAV